MTSDVPYWRPPTPQLVWSFNCGSDGLEAGFWTVIVRSRTGGRTLAPRTLPPPSPFRWRLRLRDFLACSNCPTEHQETAGCDPASSDADGNSSPVRAQPNYERCSEGAQDQHGEHQSQKRYCGSIELTHACSVQVSVIDAQ